MENSIQSFLKFWWVFLILGVLIALLGAGAIFNPLPAYMALSTFIWVSFIVTGIVEAFSAIAFRKSMPFWWANLIIGIILVLVIGIIAILLGFILPFQPIIAIGTVGIFVGLTLLVTGADFIVAAVFMRKAKKLTDAVDVSFE